MSFSPVFSGFIYLFVVTPASYRFTHALISAFFFFFLSKLFLVPCIYVDLYLLFRMINDPKSTQFIAWTELGTSFVVSNVGEFSRSILGSHFKHNNVSFFIYLLAVVTNNHSIPLVLKFCSSIEYVRVS